MGDYTPYTADAFVVRYSKKFRYLFGSYVPLFVGLAGLTIGLLHPFFDPYLGDGRSGPRYAIPIVCGILLLLTFLEFLMSCARILIARTALRVTREGVSGRQMHVDRHFKWEDILDIYKGFNTLHIIRKPRSWINKLLFRLTRQGSRHRYESVISIPLKSVDASEEEIHAAIERYAPPDFYTNLESTRRGKMWHHFELKRP